MVASIGNEVASVQPDWLNVMSSSSVEPVLEKIPTTCGADIPSSGVVLWPLTVSVSAPSSGTIDALPGSTTSDTMLGAVVGTVAPTDADFDAELERLADDVDTDPAPLET